jgi:hypothetical protein
LTETTTTAGIVRVAVKPDGIPDLFKEFSHWVVWKAVPKEDGFDKVPYNPRTGARASSTDSRTWSTFTEALEALENSARNIAASASCLALVILLSPSTLMVAGTPRPVRYQSVFSST